MSQPRAAFLKVTWGLGGLVIGAGVALFSAHGWSPDWVGAIGTWFGSIATVFTLLWAVRTFRADQERREQERRHAEDLLRLAEAARLADIALQASLITVELRGGGGFGGETMTSVHIVVKNRSPIPAVVTGLHCVEPLRAKDPWDGDLQIGSADSKDRLINVEEFTADPTEFSGRPLSGQRVVISYTLDGRHWRVGSAVGEQPERVA